MKTKVFFYSAYIILLLLLQTTLLKYLAVYGIKPNLLIVFVIITALVRGNIEGGTVGFFAGLAADMVFGGMLGFHALLGMYLGMAAGSTNRRLFRENLLVAVFFTFVYSVLYETVVYILNNIMAGSLDLIYPLSGVILPEAAYNCAAAVFIYVLLLKADRRFAETVKTVRKY